VPDGGGVPGDGGVPDAGPGPDADIALRLAAVPGLTVAERVSTVPGYRFFRLTFSQPVDHAAPDGQRFTQHLTLMQAARADAPMVLHTNGYYGFSDPRLEELARLLGGHQLYVEHRYFERSRPQPTDWRHLTVRQAAADFHRLVQALRPLYPQRWLSSGTSKGAEAVLFHRRFYPEDVHGTVAYSGPLLREDDARFPPFLATVGGEAYAACRQALTDFQRRLLGPLREEARALAEARATQLRRTYARLGFDKAFEHATLEAAFGFWQGLDPAVSCGWIPGPDASAAAHVDFFDVVAPLKAFSDAELAVFEPYFYQAGTELGFPRYGEEPLADLLRYPGTDVPANYGPVGVPQTFDAAVMQDVQDWVATRGERLLFLYGQFDPWSAAAVALGDARDAHLFVAPGLHHGARLADLPEPLQGEALALVRGWAGLPAGASAPRTAAALLPAQAPAQQPEDPAPRRRSTLPLARCGGAGPAGGRTAPPCRPRRLTACAPRRCRRRAPRPRPPRAARPG
jgi:hypothetical protein